MFRFDHGLWRGRPRPSISHRLEPLEARRLLSFTPLRPDLVATSDTGLSDTDNITRFDNAAPESALQFLVGNTTPGALVSLYIDNRLAGSATASGPSTLVTANAGLDVADGDHVAAARQTAPGDTESAESQWLVFTVDTTAPAAPAAPNLVDASDTGASFFDDLTNDTTPTFSVTSGIAYRTQVDGTIDNTVQTAPTFTTPLANGAHDVAIWEVDTAGNVSPRSPLARIRVDTVAPQASLAAPLQPPVPGASAYSFTISYADTVAMNPGSIDAADVQVIGPSGAPLPVALDSTAPADGGLRQLATYRFTPPGGDWDYPDNGDYQVRVQGSQVFDLAGNSAAPSTPGRLTVNLLMPPSAPLLLPQSDTGVSTTDRVTRLDNGSPERVLRFLVNNTRAGATVTIFADGTPIGTATGSTGATTVTTNGVLALPAGFYSITARQAQAGQVPVPDSAPVGLTIDTTPPPRPAAPDLLATSDSGVSDSDNLTNDNTPTLGLSLTLAPYFRVYRNGVPASADYATGDTFTPATALPDGVHSFTVAGVDTAGNVSEPGEPVVVTIDTVAPARGVYAGTLDPTFDGDGRRFTPGPERWDSVAPLPDGRLLLAGVGTGGQTFVARVNRDGSADTTFGNGGTAPVGDRYRAYVGVQPDGRIVFSGTTNVFRLTANGAPDPTFGNNGVAPVAFPVRDLAVAPDGKVLVTGVVGTENSGDQFATVRLLPDGRRDPTFGTNGQVTTAARVPGNGGYAFSVAPAEGGKVLVAGYGYAYAASHAVVHRYLDNGTLDPTFHGDGRVVVEVDLRSEAHVVEALPGGKVLISGITTGGDGTNFTRAFLARLNPNGTPDTTFNATGVRIIPGLRGFGGALTGGHSFLATSLSGGDIGIAHYDPAGNTDPFPNGVVTTASGLPSGFSPMNFAVTPDDKIVLVGLATNLGGQMAAYRFYGYTFGVPDLQAGSDTGASPTDNVTNDATPTFDVAASRDEPNVYFRLYRNGARVSGEYEPIGAYTAPAQPDGRWDYSAGLVDAAGNASVAGPALTVHIDTAPPQVTGVFVSSSSWSPNFTAALASSGLGDAGGYALPGGGAPATNPSPLPWSNIDRFTLRTNEPVVVRRDDLRVEGASDGYPNGAFTLDPAWMNPTWTLPGALPTDRLLLSLADTVTDIAGNRLRVLPAQGGSGGVPGSPFRAPVNLLPGDVDHNGVVNTLDLAQVRNRVGTATAAAGGAGAGAGPRTYNAFSDFNGDGRITATDYALARTRLSTRLPPPPATITVAAQPVRNAPPSRRSALLGEETPLFAG